MNNESLQELWLGVRDVSLDPAGIDLDAAGSLSYVLHQSFAYRYTGPVTRVDQRLVVVPPARHGPQRRKFHRLSIIGAEGYATWSRDEFENPVAHVQVAAVPESVEFRVDAIIEREGIAPVQLSAAALSARRYLDATWLTSADDALSSAAHDLAGSLPAGRPVAERICAFVNEAIAYRKGATSVATTAAEAFRIGAGVCQDHAHVMLAMCRALGLPSRYVSGHLLGEGATHAWVEVIVPDTDDADGAVALPFDPCHGREPGARYVMVAVGRDYGDVAPTSGTYHGRSTNHLTSMTRLGVSLAGASAAPV
jgi:transglutaminase-like putative cysteine protease